MRCCVVSIMKVWKIGSEAFRAINQIIKSDRISFLPRGVCSFRDFLRCVLDFGFRIAFSKLKKCNRIALVKIAKI